MIFLTRSSDPRVVVLFLLQAYLSILACCGQQQDETTTTTTVAPQPQSPPEQSNCALYKYVGVNDLSINDIVVKSETGDLACMKARFSLAIKVETEAENTLIAEPSDHRPGSPTEQHQHDSGRSAEASDEKPAEMKRLVLGYLPLDSIVSVKDNCPVPAPASGPPKEGQGSRSPTLDEPKELEMIVSFECGKLAFNFKQDKNFYLTSIQGVVNLDSSTVREFSADGPMFFTSDRDHHFKSTELIEVNSTAKSKAFILTANFYHLEFETFRNTNSRGFVLPPDANSMIHDTAE